ncbi:hypothetical protein ON010_g14007 [Phytophthora cinnamomi]|nr:hypothetical protein ON010_g14007 [Phytophthora cinnamomi]
MEEMQSTAQSKPAQERFEPETSRNSSTVLSVGTILLRMKLRKQNEISTTFTAEECRAVSIATSRTDLQRRVVSTIFNGCKLEDVPPGVEDVDDILRKALPGAPSRSERLGVSLMLFPELVRHICDRVLSGYGVPLNFHRRGSGNVTEVEAAALLEGFWLRTIRALPEKTAAVILARHSFHSFGFARRVFFQGLEGSPTLQLRVLKMLVERRFQAVSQDDAALAGEIDEQVTPLEQLYVLPRSVQPAEDHVETQQLLLMAEDFRQIAQMEKTQLEALEEVPFAVVNMKGVAGIPEYWEALVQILHRSSRRTSSAAFQRHNSMSLGFAIAGDPLAKQKSITLSESSTMDSTINAVTTSRASNANLQEAAASKPPPLVRSGTARRTSTQSMVNRLSAIDMMAPTYPRLVAAVDDIRSLPIHLRSNIVCFRDEYEQEPAASSGGQTQASLTKCLQSTILRLTMHPSVQTLCALVQPADDDLMAPRAPLSYFWQVLSGLVLFHATLVFRAHVLRAVYPGALLPPHHPGGVGTAFHYSDDDFLTAINQYLATILDKKQHHLTQQSRRTGRGSEYNAVLERRIYLQVVLSSYTRLAAGHQEVEFLRRLWGECLQLVSWSETSVGESAAKPATLPSFRGRSRQMTNLRDQLRGTAGDGALAVQASSKFLIKGSSSVSVVKSSLLLGFLAFPSEDLRQENLSVAQWLEVVWNYSTSIDHLMNTKLQALLLGFQQSINRRGSPEDTSRDLMTASGGIDTVNRPPPKWMAAFGWTNRNRVVLLGDPTELVASISLRDAVNVLQGIIAQALPPRFDVENWDKAEESPSLEVDGGFEAEHDAETLVVNPTMMTLATVYNQHIDACSTALEKIVMNLLKLEDSGTADHTLGGTLLEGDDGDESDDDEYYKHQGPIKDTKMVMLSDVENARVREQVVSVLRNEVPPGLFGETLVATPATSTWSLHDTLQHYQDWHHFLTESRRLYDTGPPRVWLPGILAAKLPVPHVIKVARMQYSASHFDVGVSMQFTLRYLSPTNSTDLNDQEDEDSESTNTPLTAPLPVDTFAILDGVVLLGSTWNQELQALDRLGGESALHQRVELICSLSRGSGHQPTQVTRVPLLASHNGDLLLECALAVDPAQTSNLATPFLIPTGSHYR